MSSKSDLLHQQHQWALNSNLEPDSRGYLASVDHNLFQQMNASTRSAFEKGSGSELIDTHSRPAKMKALHSSSALAVNFFDSWVNYDKSILRTVLELDTDISAIKFEEQYPTGLGGNPPNLDLAIELTGGHTIGIESKFSEWLTPKSKGTESFKSKYFLQQQGLWESKGLPGAQKLATSINQDDEVFRYLDAPQLLKHSLGMATQLGEQFSLFYIYYDWPGKESEVHNQEIERFAALIDNRLGFKAISYQCLFSSLEKQNDVDRSYMNYLRRRYFNNAD